MNVRRIVAALVLLGASAGCAPRGVPGIADPIRVDAHCSPREARITGIRSILTSVTDRLEDDRPPFAQIRTAVRSGDGAIAYWHDQRLFLPNVSATLGESDGYARVEAMAIPPAPVGALFRHVYLNVRSHGAPAWVTLRAYDVQDICIEGHKQS